MKFVLLYAIRTLSSILGQAVATPRFRMALLGGFAGFALLLSAIGLYGVLSYLVQQQTQEIGIRMALGALPGNAVGLVMRKAVGLIVPGLAIGIAEAIALSRFLEDLLFQTSVTGLEVFVEVAIVFLPC